MQLDPWVTTGAEPPASRYPKIADGTLVTLDRFVETFPKIPGAGTAESMYVPVRLDFGPRWKDQRIADIVPPRAGAPYRVLVPAVDADGNELAGIRLPDIAVPLATYTGWNLRSEQAGAAGALARLAGSYLPFAATAAEREKTGDPRLSVTERYPTREHYLARVIEAAVRLRDERFLLDEDVVEIVKAAAGRLK